VSQLLFIGGTILTQDPAQPVAQAMLIEDGAVVATGAGDEIASLARAGAETVDLAGRFVCPGFIDAHNHFVFGVLAELGTDCRTPPVGSTEELLSKLGRTVARTPSGRWVRGWGYNELDLDRGRHPALAELDRIAPDNPLVIGHRSGHMCVANTLALQAAGISTDSRDPPNGVISRDRRGGPTGLLEEHASEMVDMIARDAILGADPSQCRAAAYTVARRYAALGLTSICDPCVPRNVEPLYDEITRDPGFPLGIVGLGIGRDGMFAPPLDRLEDRPREGEDGFRVSGLKLFADGGEQCAVCMSKRGAVRTALRVVRNSLRSRSLMPARLVRAPVSRLGRDRMIHAGIKFYGDRDLAGLLSQTAGSGLVAAVHAIGNEAIDQVLDAIEAARQSCGDEAGFRMEHAMMPSEESLPRIANLGVAAVVQPIFVRDFGLPLIMTGMNREFRALAFRDLIDQGVILAGSSDAPVCDPAVLPAIESAVARRTSSGEVLDADQALSVDEALAMYTVNAAELLGLGKSRGALRRGCAADFVVLDDDPRAVDPHLIGRIQVDRTYRAGRRVYPLDA
jgi:predicted amidohydrolase YtcJ